MELLLGHETPPEKAEQDKFEITTPFPRKEPLTKADIQDWLVTIGFGDKLKYHCEPNTFLGLLSGSLEEFVRVSTIPENQGGSKIWGHLR